MSVLCRAVHFNTQLRKTVTAAAAAGDPRRCQAVFHICAAFVPDTFGIKSEMSPNVSLSLSKRKKEKKNVKEEEEEYDEY